MRLVFSISLLLAFVCAHTQNVLPVGTILPTRQTSVHDPVMIKEKDTYYLFCTGFCISVWSSKDLNNLRKEAPVFSKPPQWAVDTIPNFTGHICAPDISYQPENKFF